MQVYTPRASACSNTVKQMASHHCPNKTILTHSELRGGAHGSRSPRLPWTLLESLEAYHLGKKNSENHRQGSTKIKNATTGKKEKAFNDSSL